MNVSTCCRVFLLTCRIHCLGRLERHNTPGFFLRKMLGTRYGPVGTRFVWLVETRFSLILGTLFSILGTRLGSLKRLKKPAIPQSFQCRFSFLRSRTQQKTDKMRAEDPAEKIHACSTNSCAKSKRFILQFPTVTPSSMRLWLSIQFIWTMVLQIFCRTVWTALQIFCRTLQNSLRAGVLA